jgi:tripartite-type tricarboxylate transporter receptor subunit TctC
MAESLLRQRCVLREAIALVFATLLVVQTGVTLAQQKYPAKPVRVIYPSAAGSTGDVRTRVLADRLSQRLGQRFVVENKPGANTTIGTALAAAAPADGYTLLSTFTPTFSIGPILYKNAGYDAIRSFTPIGMYSRASPFLVVDRALPVANLKDFVALAKATPGSITVAHGGIGGTNHLPAALFARAAGIDLLYVGYKSEALAMPEVIGGQVSALFAYTAVAVPQIKAGRVRALAVAGKVRNEAVPDIPTFIESGYPDFTFEGNMLLLAPAGVPREIITLLSREIAAILEEPEVLRIYETTGSKPVYGTPEGTAALIQREMEVNGALLRELGISLD